MECEAIWGVRQRGAPVRRTGSQKPSLENLEMHPKEEAAVNRRGGAPGSWSLVSKQVEAQRALRVMPGCPEEVTAKRGQSEGGRQEQSRWVGHTAGRMP